MCSDLLTNGEQTGAVYGRLTLQALIFLIPHTQTDLQFQPTLTSIVLSPASHHAIFVTENAIEFYNKTQTQDLLNHVHIYQYINLGWLCGSYHKVVLSVCDLK